MVDGGSYKIWTDAKGSFIERQMLACLIHVCYDVAS